MNDDEHYQHLGELFDKQVDEMREQFEELWLRYTEACDRKIRGDESAAREMEELNKQIDRIALRNKQLGMEMAKLILERDADVRQTGIRNPFDDLHFLPNRHVLTSDHAQRRIAVSPYS